MIGGTGAVMTSANVPELGSGTGPPRQMTFLELGALATAVPCARLHAVNVLREWNVPVTVIHDAELIVSELMTNALSASAGLDGCPPIALRLMLSADRMQLRIEAWDRSPLDVDATAVDDDAEAGRGLMIVAALSARWGSERVGYNRKVVWAELPLPQAPQRGDH